MNRKRRPQAPTNMTRGSPFPPTKTVVLRYSDVYSLVEQAAGAGQVQQFRAADAYDPDYSGVGHQPMYFDQLCGSNGPYLVFSCPHSRWKLRIVNNSSTVAAVVVVYPGMAALPLLSRSEAVEKPYAWTKILAPLGSGAATLTTTYVCDNPKLVGVSPATFVANYNGNYGSSSGGPYLTVAVYGIAGIADVSLEVQADIKTKFYQLGNMTGS